MKIMHTCIKKLSIYQIGVNWIGWILILYQQWVVWANDSKFNIILQKKTKGKYYWSYIYTYIWMTTLSNTYNLKNEQNVDQRDMNKYLKVWTW
jgi:hypothetical protein